MTSAGQDTVCYRHPSRAAFIRCQRCDRFICPDCQRPAAVGFQCPECVHAGRQETRAAAAPYGGQRSGNPALTTLVLIGVNVVVWVLVFASGQEDGRWYHRLALLPSGRCLADGGGYFPDAGEQLCSRIAQATWAPGVAEGSWWQLATAMFTHAAITHIAMNMLAVYFIGPSVEQVLGRVRFLAVYLLSGLAGSVAVYWLSPTDSSTVGASGAIFGLIGAISVLSLKTHGDLRAAGGLILAGALVTFIGSGLIPGVTFFGSLVSWQGHLGGFVGGVVTTAIIAYAPRQRREIVQSLALAGLTLALVALVFLRSAALT